MHDILSEAKQQQHQIQIESLIYDPVSKCLRNQQGVDLKLEPRSVEILEVLLRHVGEPVSAEQIIEEVWQSNYISKTVLTNRISTLRSLLKQYLPESDINNLIITYPKKGYYLSADKVALVKNGEQRVRASNSNRPQLIRNRWIHFAYLSVIALLSTSIYFIANHPLKENEVNQANIAIPVVEILLNKVVAKGTRAGEYRKEVKTLLLAQQVAYPYTDVTNQDAPTYFLADLDDSRFWPGAKHSRSSDYKLNVRLSDVTQQDRLHVVLELLYTSSGKIAFKAEYDMYTDSLATELRRVGNDIARYFDLPPIDTVAPYSIQHMLGLTQSELVEHILRKDEVTDLEAGYLSRILVVNPNIEQEVLSKWVNLIHRSFRYDSEETKIWLGLLYFKIGDYEAAYDYLNRTLINDQVDNAFLHLLLSNIALETERSEEFRIHYLKSLVALSVAIPSEEIFKRLAKPETSASCLSPWLSLSLNTDREEKMKPWVAVFDGYCQRADKYLQID